MLKLDKLLMLEMMIIFGEKVELLELLIELIQNIKELNLLLFNILIVGKNNNFLLLVQG